MSKYEIPEGYTIALIATMPRSGTWYSFYFLEFLDIHLTGRTNLNTRLDLEVYHGLNLGKVHLHTICPGFLEICQGPERRKWDDLDFYNPGFNYGYERFIAGNETVFAPNRNRDIRIVYIYRNPLDQAVSYFRHTQKHRQPTTRTAIDSTGREVAIKDARDYLRRVGIEAFIKQYFTYHCMSERFADNVRMICYENLAREPEKTFMEMLNFLNFQIDTEEKWRCFRRAAKSTTIESLRNLETAIAAPLGRDQGDPGESHMRGGEIGKWRNRLAQDDREFVETRLRDFGLSLQDFVIE